MEAHILQFLILILAIALLFLWAKSSAYNGKMPFSFNGDNYSSGLICILQQCYNLEYWEMVLKIALEFPYPDSKWHHFAVINDEKQTQNFI